MAGSLVAAFSSSEVRGEELLALYDGISGFSFEGCDNHCAFNERSADLDGGAVADKQNPAYLKGFGVRGDISKLDIERFAGANLVLFTALFDYRIHFNTPVFNLRHRRIKSNIQLRGRIIVSGLLQ